jgi:hypothetical protein
VEHENETAEHERLVRAQLERRGAKPSPAKLAGCACAFEALEVGAYELLTRVARRAGDADTAAGLEATAGS